MFVPFLRTGYSSYLYLVLSSYFGLVGQRTWCGDNASMNNAWGRGEDVFADLVHPVSGVNLRLRPTGDHFISGEQVTKQATQKQPRTHQ